MEKHFSEAIRKERKIISFVEKGVEWQKIIYEYENFVQYKLSEILQRDLGKIRMMF